MALPILPILLLLGGGAFVLANAGKKKSSGKRGAVGPSQCQALEKLNELGPGVLPGAKAAVTPEIAAIPMNQREAPWDFRISYTIDGERFTETVRPLPMAVYTVAQRAYERLCRESAPQVVFERWTLEKFVQSLRDTYGEEPIIGETAPDDLVAQFLSGERKVIVTGLRIEDSTKTLEQKEAFAWLLQAAGLEMFNATYLRSWPTFDPGAPKLDYSIINSYIRDNSQALYNPTLAWGDDLSYIGKPNKNFDFGMFQYLENQLDFYLGPGGIQFAEREDTASELVAVISRKYLRDVMGISSSELPITLYHIFAMQWEAATTMPDYCILGTKCAATGFTFYNAVTDGAPVYFVRGDGLIKTAGNRIGVPLLQSGLTQSLDIAARVALLGTRSAFFTSAADLYLPNDMPTAPLQFVYMQPGPARDQAEAAFEASSPYIYELWQRVRSDIDGIMQTGMGFGNN